MSDVFESPRTGAEQDGLPRSAPSSSLFALAEGGYAAQFGEYRLSSHFQPIYGLSLQRPVGYEALLRASDAAGRSVPPLSLFSSLSSAQGAQVDRLSHRLHVQNYRDLVDSPRWLFLNMTPQAFLQARNELGDESFANRLRSLGFPTQRLVIEVLEEHVRDDGDFESAVAFFRELGCLVALDDFGAGSSNFDRVWKIRPQIVKLDRSVIVQSVSHPNIRRLLPQMVSLLHEAGALVLVEGVETEDEACVALDANVDFAQGYLFGHPQAGIARDNEKDEVLNALWARFEGGWRHDRAQQKNLLSPYTNAIGYASVLLSAGRSMTESCASFLDLPDADICFLLDQDGRQIGGNLWSDASRPGADPRLAPLQESTGARWARTPYFRRAIESHGTVQVTRPYLSISSARLCVTVSVSFKIDGRTRVVCGDLRCH